MEMYDNYQNCECVGVRICLLASKKREKHQRGIEMTENKKSA